MIDETAAEPAGAPEVVGRLESSAEPAGGPEVVGRLESSAAALDELAGLPVTEHVARYDALHGELSEALAAIDGI